MGDGRAIEDPALAAVHTAGRPIARVLPLLEPAHLDRDFDYLVPAEMDDIAQPGVRVRIRFSGRLIDGFLLERLEKTDHTGKLMSLERVVSGERVLTPEILRLVNAVASRYAGTRADVLRLAIPPRHARTEAEGIGGERKSPRRKKVDKLQVTADSADIATEAAGDAPTSSQAATVVAAGEPPMSSRSATEGVVDDESMSSRSVTEGVAGDASASGQPATEVVAGGASISPRADVTESVPDDRVVPTSSAAVDSPAAQFTSTDSVDAAGRAAPEGCESPHSKEALAPAASYGPRAAGSRDRAAGRIASSSTDAAEPRAVSSAAPNPTEPVVDPAAATAWGRYVHGVSFLTALVRGRGPRAAWQALPGEDWARRLAELAAATVRSGRSAVLIVPDQRDLDRVIAECTALVGESAVGLAAGLGPAARYRRWLAVLRGSARVVVGTRSTVFAPAQNLGLIAIWDDGDDTYAEPRSPYSHAREVAMLRAHETGAAFVVGGFARTAEAQAIVESGWAHDLLADRAALRECTPHIVAPGDTDMAMERDPLARAVRIPGVAFLAAQRALAAGAPVLVQVPRRGYIPALSCAKCRTPARCRHCNGPLALPEDGTGAVSVATRGGSKVGSAAGPAGAVRSSSGEVAHSPSCRWCGIVEAAFRCQACGSRALRAVVIGAVRTAEELGRAFPGVPIRGSGGGTVLSSVPEGPQVVVSTIGAEPTVPGGYGVALLLDGWALLGRADLRAAEDALRRWMTAAALVRPSGQVIVMAEPTIPTVQALLRWDPVGHAHFELSARTEVRFPPAVRLAAIDGTTDTIAELLSEAKLPEEVEVLGPVPLPFGARKPVSGDTPAEVERMILRVDRGQGAALARALAAAQAVRSTHRSDGPLRVQIDPIDIG
ncbi:primosomal protein N' [Nocardia uniformis]|uniref:primosomal protein N' n=1 Tax=Nocardia uniformis TaxID=53432 RepID=UPI001FE1505B|nr:primosomal protein N' [Nocardia uniformis]